MQTPHIKQTLRQAKQDFKKAAGPRIPEHELKKFERRAELEGRAADAREREKKRKQAKRKREEKDERERESKRRNGFGLATQLAGYSHTQKQMKGIMEAFVSKPMVPESDKENVAACESPETGSERTEDDEHNGRIVARDDLAADEFGAVDDYLFDDEALLAHMEADRRKTPSKELYSSSNSPQQHMLKDVELRSLSFAQSVNNVNLKKSLSKHVTYSPGLMSSPPASPWAEFLTSNTQIARELSQPPDLAMSKSNRISPNLLRTEDLDISSADFSNLQTPCRTSHLVGNPFDAVIVRDFAASTHPRPRGILYRTPHISNRGSKKPLAHVRRGAVMGTSPKITGGGFRPGVAQRSFSSKFEEYGLSTQMLQDAVDETESDTEEEDFVSVTPATADRERFLMPPPQKDKVLMPCPRSRTSPKDFQARKMLGTEFSEDPRVSMPHSQDLARGKVDNPEDEAAHMTSSNSSHMFDGLDADFWDEVVLDGLGNC